MVQNLSKPRGLLPHGGLLEIPTCSGEGPTARSYKGMFEAKLVFQKGWGTQNKNIEFTQQDGRKKNTAKRLCVTNVTGL